MLLMVRSPYPVLCGVFRNNLSHLNHHTNPQSEKATMQGCNNLFLVMRLYAMHCHVQGFLSFPHHLCIHNPLDRCPYSLQITQQLDMHPIALYLNRTRKPLR
jgi:hypothetical protein